MAKYEWCLEESASAELIEAMERDGWETVSVMGYLYTQSYGIASTDSEIRWAVAFKRTMFEKGQPVHFKTYRHGSLFEGDGWFEGRAINGNIMVVFDDILAPEGRHETFERHEVSVRVEA